jgi:hypothetical protein
VNPDNGDGGAVLNQPGLRWHPHHGVLQVQQKPCVFHQHVVQARENNYLTEASGHIHNWVVNVSGMYSHNLTWIGCGSCFNVIFTLKKNPNFFLNSFPVEPFSYSHAVGYFNACILWNNSALTNLWSGIPRPTRTQASGCSFCLCNFFSPTIQCNCSACDVPPDAGLQ